MRFCIFSRITPTKGIEDAIKAVSLANEKAGKTIATLDMYGNVEACDRPWFDAVKASMPETVAYWGRVEFDKSVFKLKEYTALLFPTYYPGEGLAGTVIDAFAAGLPIIASDWHDNANIITDNKNGFIFPTRDVNRLAEIILDIYKYHETQLHTVGTGISSVGGNPYDSQGNSLVASAVIVIKANGVTFQINILTLYVFLNI